MSIRECIKGKIEEIKEAFKELDNRKNNGDNFIEVYIEKSKRYKMINILNIVATSILGLISLGIFIYVVLKGDNSDIGIGITVFVIIVIIIIPSIHFYLDNKLYFDNLKDIKICLNMNDENLEFDFIKLNKSLFYINNENFKLYNDINIRLKGYILNIKENENKKNNNKNGILTLIKGAFTVLIAPILVNCFEYISIENFNDNIVNNILLIILVFWILYIIYDIYLISKRKKQNRENRINNLLMYIHIELENKIANYVLNKENNLSNDEKWSYVI
ncbi:hypothetical protein [uncultured Clostridium sp.]|uniref:hypothetical protein n=1 Tax=uncultured Clostridium sp. TaxID=59620 RepID=UPI0025842CA3|nr:hypothetical protein [uncultured Clostridium sp.]